MADLHLDLPRELLFRHRAGEWDVIAQKYLSVWQKAGIALIGAAVYLEDDCLPESGLRNALLQIHALKQELQSLEEGASDPQSGRSGESQAPEIP